MLRALMTAAFILVLGGRAMDANVLYATPTRLYESVAPGTAIERTLRVTAASEDTVNVSVEAIPFVLDVNGRPSHAPARGRALGDWLHIETSASSVDPQHPLTVKVRVDVPATARGTYWTAVMIEWTSRVSAADGSAVNAVVRFAVPVVITATGTEERHAEIDDVAGSLEADTLTMVARIHNSGNTALHAPVVFAIEKDEGGGARLELASATTATVLLLPGASRLVTMRIARPKADLRGVVIAAFYRYGSATSEVVSIDGLLRQGGLPATRGKSL
jgi:hypothetical protein